MNRHDLEAMRRSVAAASQAMASLAGVIAGALEHPAPNRETRNPALLLDKAPRLMADLPAWFASLPGGREQLQRVWVQAIVETAAAEEYSLKHLAAALVAVRDWPNGSVLELDADKRTRVGASVRSVEPRAEDRSAGGSGTIDHSRSVAGGTEAAAAVRPTPRRAKVGRERRVPSMLVVRLLEAAPKKGDRVVPFVAFGPRATEFRLAAEESGLFSVVYERPPGATTGRPRVVLVRNDRPAPEGMSYAAEVSSGAGEGVRS